MAIVHHHYKKVSRNDLVGPKLVSTRKKLLGTTASVICRLEGADYEGHSLAMLKLYAAALNLTAKRLAGSAKRLFSGSDQRNLLMSHYKIV